MTKFRKQRRVTAFLLSLVMLALAIPPSVLWAEEAPDTVRILCNGEVTESVLLHENSELTLTAETDLGGVLYYQWEILTRSGKWVKISGKNINACHVNYALVCNAMGKDLKAQLRCVVGRGFGDETYTSDPVTVTLSVRGPMLFAPNNGSSEVPISDANEIATGTPSPSEDVAGSSELAVVTVHYQFKEGGQANPPSVLTYRKGTNVNRYVNSPNIVGYRPVYYVKNGEETVELSAESVLVRFDNIQEDKELFVLYLPTLVKYQVHHHLQMLTGDEYETEPFYVEDKTGYTGMEVTDSAMVMEGFQGRTHKSFTIAADGSTVVEVYYDRVYYHVDFDLDGGYGTNSLYTRYGASITADTPVHPGYKFVQWILVECYGKSEEKREPTQDEKLNYAIVDETTVITVEHNLTYEAIWALDYTSYTVVYWKENADDDQFSFWGSKTVGLTDDGVYDQTVSTGIIVSGTDDFVADDKQYFTFDHYRTDKNVVVKNDGSTIVNVYYRRNVYQLDFFGYVPSGSCQFEQHIHGDGSCDQTMICGYIEHTHGAECLPICGKTEHTHSDACCTKAICATHSAACFPSGVVGTRYTGNTWNFPSNPVDGYIHKVNSFFRTAAYIYVNGTWYTYGKAVNTVSSGDIIGKICHYAHGVGGCSCAEEEHAHADLNNCYKDYAHTHTDTCYICTKIEHDHSNAHDGELLVYVITAKYEENIGAKWPTYDTMLQLGAAADSRNRAFYGWEVDGVSSTYVSKRLNMTAELCGKNAYASYQSGAQTTYYYLFEDVDQDNSVEIPLNASGQGRVQYNNVWYVSNPDYYQVLSANNLSAKEVLGMVSQNSSPSNYQDENGNTCKCFFYKRNADSDIVLSFYNVDRVDESFSYADGLKFGIPISRIPAILSYVADENEPGYPQNLEKGGFAFDQWYTTPECFPGTEVDWSNLKMPDGGLTVYAKWVPVQHTVNVYKDVNKDTMVGPTQLIDHGHHAVEYTLNKNENGLIFVGWFYQDEDGNEQYFKFNSMPVKQDLEIYAKWHSTILVNYAVYFQLEDGTNVADPNTGSVIAGYNTTFHAAKGAGLYEAYQEGYFPRVSSHSLLMKQGEDGDTEFVNTYTFIYEKHEKLTYQVHYVDQTTGNRLLPSIEANGYFVEITEIFKYVAGYETDTYSITKTLSTQGSNEITFYYTPVVTDPGNSPYRVSAYLQDLEDTTHYSEFQRETVCPLESSAPIGSNVTVNVFSIDGFVPVRAVRRSTGEELPIQNGQVEAGALPQIGMEIIIYYDRVEVEYTVEYHYQYVSGGESLTQRLLEPETRKGLYGQTVSASALDLTGIGYGLVSEPTATRILDSITAKETIIFVYKENDVVFQYHSVLGRDGTKTLGSETVPAFTGAAEGVLPENTADYTFVGWYLDERCSFPVVPGEKVSVDPDTGRLVPQKVKKTVNGQEYEVYETATYYALFEPNYSTLIIDVVQSEGVSMEQTFLYRIEGIDDDNREIDLTVAIHGTYVATVKELPVGSYRVTEISNWAWRYDPDQLQKTVFVTVDDTRLNFTYTVSEDRWLSAESFDHHIVPTS